MIFPIAIIPNNTNIDFIGRKNYAFLISLLLSLCVVCFLFTRGLNFGIDFTGGMIFDVHSSDAINLDTFRIALKDNGYNKATIQEDRSQGIIIRLQTDLGDSTQKTEKFQSFLIEHVKGAEFRKIDYVGPKVGAELVEKAILAIVISLLGIMIYVAIRFDWPFAIGITLALLHDALITVGFYIFTQYEFDLTSVAALLTVIGYSVNDSVVIYDRIRENLQKYSRQSIAKTINLSINETLSRTIMTVLTTLLVCLALILLGGSHLRGFSAAMFFGIAFGTYSSIYISAPILILIDKRFKLTGTIN